jgi:hypothetical protein
MSAPAHICDNEEKRLTAAITAEAIATPFVMALVVLLQVQNSHDLAGFFGFLVIQIVPGHFPMPLALSEIVHKNPLPHYCRYG